MEGTVGRKRKLGFVKFYKYMVGNPMTVHFLCPSSRKAMVKLEICCWNGRANKELSYRRRLQFFRKGQDMSRCIWGLFASVLAWLYWFWYSKYHFSSPRGPYMKTTQKVVEPHFCPTSRSVPSLMNLLDMM